MTLEEIFRRAAERQAKNWEGCCGSIACTVYSAWYEEQKAQDEFAKLFKRGNQVYWWSDPYFQEEKTRTARVIALCLAAEIHKEKP